ncbi:MAG: RidA family protein [Ilumatobacteraceae bacterium]|jgi:enamine deaminase RidA (YjgF/YER057c/UK114 family)
MDPVGTSEVRPESMAPPAAKYAHAVRVDAPASMVFTSGVVPVMPDGTVPATIEGQARSVWANLIEILKASEMKVANIVSITTYVVATESLSDNLAAVMAVRDEVMGEHRAASTLVTVPALARPEWRMEIALVAAR